MRASLCIVLLLACLSPPTLAYEPIPRRLPKPGKPVADPVRTELEKQLATLEGSNEPDVEIYTKAVRLALEFDEFYDLGKDVPKARAALTEAAVRREALAEGRPAWRRKTGLSVRGYRSSIDGSAQPYGLEIPAGLELTGKPVPLYVWLHGRGDAKTDLHFIDERSKKHWQFRELLDDGIVLHPFGRQCIGYKSAGEIDVLEAVDHVLANYNVDPDRVALMGFSMGGAGAWHLGAHYPDRWAVVHAGAGFVDVKRYQKLGPDKLPSPIEQTLWGVYDVPNYTRNLFNLPVIAYSGELDKQKDAADYMAETYAAHGKELPHVIGSGMGHKYDPASREQVARFIKRALAKPKTRKPQSVSLQTRTLRYNVCAWVYIVSLLEHWKDSRVDAAFVAPDDLRITTKNVSGLRIQHNVPDGCRVRLDDETFTVIAGGPSLSFQMEDGRWHMGRDPNRPLHKSASVHGPIDDAFLAPFLVVKPTGKSEDPALDRWVEFELAHLQSRWRALFRGDLRIKTDSEVTGEDVRNFNLVLFGTPESNKLIAKTIVSTPLEWPAEPKRVLLSIYPNPEAPYRYVVLNSGPTFREGHDRTNSLQNPKLGDWAIIDLAEPPGPDRPGKIIKAGFFNENWQLK